MSRDLDDVFARKRVRRLEYSDNRLIENPARCTFDPSTLLCKSAETDACLTQKQVESLKRLYGGP